MLENYRKVLKMSLLIYSLVLLLSTFQATTSGKELKNHERNISQIKNIDNSMQSMVASMKDDSGTMSTAITYNNYQELDQSDESKQQRRKRSLDWSMSLDSSNRFHLSWSVDYPNNLITFALEINKTLSNFQEGSDIFALGFSQYGQLNNSDFCIIWYDLSHKIHLQTARTNSENHLELIDESQSICKLSTPEAVSSNRIRRLKHENKVNENHDDNDEDIVKIKFTRTLDACETNLTTYYIIDNGTTHLIWFTLKGPLLTFDGLNLNEMLLANQNHNHNQTTTHHQIQSETFNNFGMNRVQLIANKPNRHNTVKNHNHHFHEVRMEKFQVPSRETTYWCKLFKLPKKFQSRKYHITRYEPIIEKNNEHLVHHMELFNCVNLNPAQEVELKQLYYKDGGWSGECADINRPKVTLTCRKVIMAWAMGAHPLDYPSQVGQSIGGSNYSPYVVLEVHYNNLGQTSGISDSSGLKFHYTNKLRPYEAGILEVGLEYTDKYAIPPNLIMPLAGYCVSECTRVGLISSGSGGNTGSSQTATTTTHFDSQVDNGKSQDVVDDLIEEDPIGSDGLSDKTIEESIEEGIYIFASQLHTHLVGISSWTEIIREGKLLGELQRDNHYSPHFQEIRFLPKPVHLVPGDALVHYCLYDTRKRVNVTLGGEATTDEMCVTYLHYYPRLDLEVCKSSVDTKALEAYFAYLSEEENQNTSKLLSEGIESLSDGDFAKDFKSSNNNSNNIITNENYIKRRKSVDENYRSIEWTKKRSEELLEFYSNAPLSIQCNRSNGNRFPGYWNGIEPTVIWNRNNNDDLISREEEEDNGGGGGGGGQYNLKPPTKGRQLMAYRGRNFARRHAQCSLFNKQK